MYDDLPVGFVDAGALGSPLYFVHTDHLGSPRKLTNAAKTVVWDMRHGPFGEPGGVTGSLAQNLRFPGQYADGESALSYNWRRTYDPSLGRYLQSDPIGLAGGINTYGYVDGNPLIYTDPTGECPWCIPVLVGAVSSAGLDLALQLLQNGGDLNCIDWESLGLSAALGGGGGGLSAKLLKLLAKGGASKSLGVGAAVGRRGTPLQNAPYQPVRNAPVRIGGRDYTGHALDQIQNRGLTPSVVRNTITRGEASPGNTPGTTRFFDPVNNVKVITDTATGRVITVY